MEGWNIAKRIKTKDIITKVGKLENTKKRSWKDGIKESWNTGIRGNRE
jgi:hypothetical protein